MYIKTFAQPSKKQLEVYGQDAKRHMMDQFIVKPGRGYARIGAVDFAPVPGNFWRDPDLAKARGLPEDTLFDGGVIGAYHAVTALENLAARGTTLISRMNNAVLRASARKAGVTDLDAMRAIVKQDRGSWPTGYMAVVDVDRLDGDAVQVEVTAVGDVYVALDAGGRTPLGGSTDTNLHCGEILAGADKYIDTFKDDLRVHARAYLDRQAHRFPNWNKKDRDQFAHAVLCWHRNRLPEFSAGLGDIQAMVEELVPVIRDEALRLEPRLTLEQFHAMIENGMIPWQQQYAQNGEGIFAYAALDGVDDTLPSGITLKSWKLGDAFTGDPIRITLWTDGSKPKRQDRISMDDLVPVHEYGEQTIIELTVKSGATILSSQTRSS